MSYHQKVHCLEKQELTTERNFTFKYEETPRIATLEVDLLIRLRLLDSSIANGLWLSIKDILLLSI